MEKDNKPKKILIAEDNETLRASLTTLFTYKNFAVEAVGDGKSALERAVKNKPDVILLDAIMPVMDGYETYRQLKNNPETKDIPIIFCTATPAYEIEKRGIKLGAYLQKPFSLDHLCKKIAEILSP